MMMVHHFLSILDAGKKGFIDLLKVSQQVKKNPKKYNKALYEKVLLTFFAAPSLRTELSFDTAMFQMGGEVIDYHAEVSPWAKGKESLDDVAKVVSRYCDVVMIRMNDHPAILKFAKNASIPVINGLSDVEHPCQAVADFLTILEKKKKLKGLTLAYVGDSNNNVTHSLIYGATLVGMNMNIGCPRGKEFSPDPKVVAQARKLGGKVFVTDNPTEAVKNADVVYTDSWMSYRIPASQKNKRMKLLKPYQVNTDLMRHAKKNAMFMHCLPALRGMEVTKGVIDGKQSVVFDQAENRLHTEKAILLRALKA